ncbi:MAG: glycosyltransferase family 4 protein [Pseudomonadota bacterium]
MTTSIESVLRLPDTAASDLRNALGLAQDASLRISYLPGPGDLHTTYQHWKQREFDPRVPSVAYSTMFFEVCKSLRAQGQVVTRAEATQPPIKDENFLFFTVPYKVGGGGLGYHLGRQRYATACLEAVRAFKPHIAVVASDLEPRHLSVIKRSDAKIVYSMHNTFWPMGEAHLSLKKRLANTLAKRSLTAIDAAICTSHECERQLQSLSASALQTFVETPQQIERTTRANGPRKGPATRLLYLGRIEEPKGVFDLLDSFEVLFQSRPGLRLSYLGAGAVLSALQNEIASRNLEDVVEAPGHVDSKEVHNALANSHILVCPTRTSFNEGLAFVCFEAALHAAPTVMSTVVPARDLLKGGCAVFEADSTSAMTNELARLIDDAAAWEELSGNAIKRAEVVFDREQSWGTLLYHAFLAASKKSQPIIN